MKLKFYLIVAELSLFGLNTSLENVVKLEISNLMTEHCVFNLWLLYLLDQLCNF